MAAPGFKGVVLEAVVMCHALDSARTVTPYADMHNVIQQYDTVQFCTVPLNEITMAKLLY